MRDQFRRESDFIGELCTGFCLDQSGYTPARIPEDLDWHYIVNRGEEHHILPILESVLSSRSADLPIHVSETLECAYRETLGRNLACIAWTDRFLSECGVCGIPVILLKGSSHCRDLYHDVGLRPFTDIDLLVAVGRVKKAAEVLEGLGMRIEPGHNLDELLRIYNHATYVIADGADTQGVALKVELHWGFHQASTPARFDMEAVWKDAVPSGNHLRLSLEDELIFGSHHLCEHLFFNASPALLWICDLALRLKTSERDVNWDMFVCRNEVQRTWPTATVALGVLRRLFEIPVPKSVSDSAIRSVPGAVVRLAEQLTMGDVVEEGMASRLYPRLFAQMALNTSMRSKISFLSSNFRAAVRSFSRPRSEANT